MYQQIYTFGGVRFAILSEHPLVILPKFEAFRAEDNSPCDYTLKVVCSENSEASRVTADRHENTFTVYVPEQYLDSIGLRSIFNGVNAANLFLEHDGFVLHASYILWNGSAILFTAPSGTGKSTQAEFWKNERGAEIINGDRVLITMRNGSFFANGVFVSGTSGICRNETAPIKQIVYLEQGEENELVPLPPHQLFLRLLCQCTFDAESETQYERITTLVSALISTVPVCCYRCRNHTDSVAALERLLWNKK